MRRLAALAVLAFLAGQAIADDGDDDAFDKPTAIRITHGGATARIQARFAFDVDGPGVELNAHTFAIPRNGVVTAATVTVDGTRHALRLENAEAADKAFEALTLKPGTGSDRSWAFVIDGGNDQVTLDLMAPHNAHVVLDLALEVGTCFVKDARFVELPESWWQRVPAKQRTAIPTDGVGEICDDSGDETSHWIGVASRDLMKQSPGEHRIGTIAGRLPLDSTHFARVEIDVASVLTDVPADLHTAIVIDHSRSLSTDELEAQRATALAYVRGAPMSHVQVIGYARTAEPLLPSWMVASHAAPQIDRAIRALPPRNGSNVDAALGEAVAWLSRVQGTKRIVLFSDERLAERFGESAALRALVPDGVLVHVVHPTTGGSITRFDDEESVLATLAKATEGIAVFAGVDDGATPDATMLLRPISIDHLAVSATGWKTVDHFADMHECGDSLAEGMTCTWWGEGDGAAGPITIAGLLWNKPIKRVVRADPTQARTLARALSVMHVLDVDLQEQVDQVALAINSVWSLFGEWGGDGGYEDIGGLGTFGFGRIGTTSHDTGIGTSIGHLLQRLDLSAQLKQAITSCNPGTARGGIDVETTLEEIVAVEVTVTPANPTLHDCLVEAVWNTTLGIGNAPQSARTHVAFGNKR
ncbi:MAG TPA: VWA domain-containing protein [Kofleriaceae bacterium]|nr:VWA domain-containing protein [Kofleriaceae bacterium]